MSPGSWVLPEELRQLAECGDESLVKEVLNVFRTDTAERLAKLRNALERGDLAQVKGQAHSMKGSASQVGARSVAMLCQQIEAEALTADPATLRDVVDRVEAEFAAVIRVMPA